MFMSSHVMPLLALLLGGGEEEGADRGQREPLPDTPTALNCDLLSIQQSL